jgi:uncharacterized protein YbjT (DUF2867 family)
MKILLTGVTGYIGKRLLPRLTESGHQVICCVRDKARFNPSEEILDKIEVIEVDFEDRDSLSAIPQDIDAAYYLIHSMSTHSDFKSIEEKTARNFKDYVSKTKCQQTIYLSGIVNENELSEHLESRLSVERILGQGEYHLTTFRAGIVIGSGSASFEIIRDIVEKLPVMITPKWLNTKCQPIGIRDVLSFLEKGLLNEQLYDQHYDIGGPDILTYKEMLLGYAEARDMKRWIYTVPVMTPKLSSYWLYFITSTSFKLASSLVNSMKVEVVCTASNINKITGIDPLTYKEALSYTLNAIDDKRLASSWKDALTSSDFRKRLSDFNEVPDEGVFKDQRTREISNRQKTLERVWRIGGITGWYYGNWMWRIRGFFDKLVGGVGLRRGRTHPDKINVGDALDFWRVLYANKEEGQLVLFAEMKLPGEAWLSFKVKDDHIEQTATFRPKGLMGRLYWYSVYPFHGFIFSGMLKRISD